MDTTDGKVEEFFSQFRKTSFKAGEILFGSNDTPPGIFYLKNGFVKEYAVSEEGAELILHIYEPKTHFPMTWAIADIPNQYIFTAITDIEVFITPKEKVISFFKENPEVLYEFTKRILSGLNGLSLRIEITAFGKTQTRVVSALLYLARHFGVREGDSVILDHRFTHQDIASLIGITREHVSLEIEKLTKEGLIDHQTHAIKITDIQKLQSILTL